MSRGERVVWWSSLSKEGKSQVLKAIFPAIIKTGDEQYKTEIHAFNPEVVYAVYKDTPEPKAENFRLDPNKFINYRLNYFLNLMPPHYRLVFPSFPVLPLKFKQGSNYLLEVDKNGGVMVYGEGGIVEPIGEEDFPGIIIVESKKGNFIVEREEGNFMVGNMLFPHRSLIKHNYNLPSRTLWAIYHSSDPESFLYPKSHPLAYI